MYCPGKIRSQPNPLLLSQSDLMTSTKSVLTAEGRIEDNVLVLEMSVDIASIPPRKGGGWGAPLRWIWCIP